MSKLKETIKSKEILKETSNHVISQKQFKTVIESSDDSDSTKKLKRQII